jgi:hypothetical protein
MSTCRRILERWPLGIFLIAAIFGCTQSQETESNMADSAQQTDSPNRALLDEVNGAKRWFHAKKVHPIWARQVENDGTVQTLEGKEEVSAGDYLCRGAADEIWPQSAANLEKKYDATDEVDEQGWRKFTPKPDAEGVMAARVAHPFEVRASWGKLSGKAGDFLAKNFADRDVPYPDDVWIVDQTLFEATYEKVEP